MKNPSAASVNAKNLPKTYLEMSNLGNHGWVATTSTDFSVHCWVDPGSALSALNCFFLSPRTLRHIVPVTLVTQFLCCATRTRIASCLMGCVMFVTIFIYYYITTLTTLT